MNRIPHVSHFTPLSSRQKNMASIWIECYAKLKDVNVEGLMQMSCDPFPKLALFQNWPFINGNENSLKYGNGMGSLYEGGPTIGGPWGNHDLKN